jgi:hypothetical protein
MLVLVYTTKYTERIEHLMDNQPNEQYCKLMLNQLCSYPCGSDPLHINQVLLSLLAMCRCQGLPHGVVGAVV